MFQSTFTKRNQTNRFPLRTQVPKEGNLNGKCILKEQRHRWLSRKRKTWIAIDPHNPHNKNHTKTPPSPVNQCARRLVQRKSLDRRGRRISFDNQTKSATT